MFQIFLSVALAGGPTMTLPVQTGIAPALSKRYSPQAYALAEMLAPSDAPADRMIADIRAEMAKSGMIDDAREMERDYPGITAELQKALEDNLGGKMKKQFQGMREGYAEDYQRELAPAEIDRLVAFFATPAGRKIAAARDETVDPAEVLRRLIGKVEVTGPNTAKRMVVADRIIGSLGASEAAEARAFTATPAFAHFAEVSADSTRLERDLANVRGRASQGLMAAMVGVMEKRTGMHMPTPAEMQGQMQQLQDINDPKLRALIGQMGVSASD